MPSDDAWDWPLLLYVATTILKRSEASFWRTTPRKLSALVKVHVEVNSDKSSPRPGKQQQRQQKVYIDQLF